MSEQWTSYVAAVNGAPASVFVDLAFAPVAPDAERPMRVCVDIQMLRPRPDGLSSEEESEALFAFEDDMAQALEAAVGAHFVGRITAGGHRQFFLYARTTAGLREAALALFGRYPQYKLGAQTHADAEWTHYRTVLVPTPDTLQRAKNFETLAQLAAHGDDPSVARPVAHFAYFPSALARDAFVRRARELAFALSDGGIVDASGRGDARLPFGAVVERTQTTDYVTIDATVLPLAALARSLDGSYDGWETMVVRASGG